LLRALGATPRQVRKLVLREALLLALAAAGAGALASVAGAPLLGRWVAGRGLAPHDMSVPPSLKAIALGAAFMLAAGGSGASAAGAVGRRRGGPRGCARRRRCGTRRSTGA